MEWLWYVLMIVVVVGAVIGYIRKNLGLKDALGGLGEIRGLGRYARKAMADGKLDEKEREEIIDRIAEVAKKFV